MEGQRREKETDYDGMDGYLVFERRSCRLGSGIVSSLCRLPAAMAFLLVFFPQSTFLSDSAVGGTSPVVWDRMLAVTWRGAVRYIGRDRMYISSSLSLFVGVCDCGGGLSPRGHGVNVDYSQQPNLAPYVDSAQSA